MNLTETRLTIFVQDIILYLEELADTDPDNKLLGHSNLFTDGTAPTIDDAVDFYLAFVPEEGTRRDALVEYFALLEDAVMVARERAEAPAAEDPGHRLFETEDVATSWSCTPNRPRNYSWADFYDVV